MTDDNVTVGTFAGNPYPQLQWLQDDLLQVIRQRAGTVPVAAVIGVLRLVEHVLVQEHSE